MNVWRLITHHKDAEAALKWCLSESRIAIGWGSIGDLRQLAPQNASAITSMIREDRPELKNSHLGGPSLWHFYAEMVIGDLVIISDGRHRHAVMSVTSEYEWTEDSLRIPSSDYYHQRCAETTEDDPDDLWERCGPEAIGESIRWTLIRCKGKP